MANNDPNATEHVDEAADTASFKRFVDQEESAPGPVETGGGGRGFRLLTLAVGGLALIAVVVWLMQ
jgi:hypothetical protein